MDTAAGAYDVLAAACPSRDIFNRVGERWTPLTILALEDGPMRFNELRRRVEGVTQKMLTQTVRGLERDGLVLRTVVPTVPVTVIYELTDLGRSLGRAIAHLRGWAYDHVDAITAARSEYDARE